MTIQGQEIETETEMVLGCLPTGCIGFSVILVIGLWAGHQRNDIQFAVWTETCLFTVGR